MGMRFIMTAFGQDRPGIAADVTEILYANDCNLEDTSMTLLAGEFTLILLFSTASADVSERLSKACRRLEMERGISAFFRPVELVRASGANGFSTHTIHVEGLDHGGIVYKISRFLADSGINIADLKSSVRAMPESGGALYRMDIQVQIPDAVAMDTVKQGLSAVADDLNVDIAVSAA